MLLFLFLFSKHTSERTMKSNDSYLIALKKFDKILIHNREGFFPINNLNPISFTCPHNSPRQIKNK